MLIVVVSVAPAALAPVANSYALVDEVVYVANAFVVVGFGIERMIDRDR